jgi:hypothetical protein
MQNNYESTKAKELKFDQFFDFNFKQIYDKNYKQYREKYNFDEFQEENTDHDENHEYKKKAPAMPQAIAYDFTYKEEIENKDYQKLL